jgi:competence protein ComEA
LYLNQAVKLSDGERIYVPTTAEVAAGEAYPGSETAAEAQSSGSSTDGRMNINTATLEELMTLSGIGETKAKAIISYREKNGSFQNPADIKNVSGIGDSTYSNIAEYITVQ